MFLHEVIPESRVFIDANIFVYHFSEGSEFNKSCTEFLSRIEIREIYGITSTATVVEAVHRLMMVEASSILDVDVRNLPKYLRQHPDTVKQLTKHCAVPKKIAELNIEIVQINQKTIEESQFVKAQYGFLSNDALIIRLMETLGLSILASNDLDFRRVDWVKLYLPSPTSLS